MKKLVLILSLLFPICAFAGMGFWEPRISGLVGYWPLNFTNSDGTVMDASGNGNTGTLGNAPSPVAGVIGNALSFNGTSQYITLDSSSNFIAYANAPFTISFYFKASTIYAGSLSERVINFHRGSTAGSSFAFGIGGSNKIQFFNYSSSATYSSVANISAGIWYQASVTYNGTSFQLYVNGNADGSPITATLTAGGSYPAIIGSYDGSTIFFNGSIDDVRIYNRALSASEVKQLYSGIGVN